MSRDREPQIGDLTSRRCKSSTLRLGKESKAKTKPGKQFRGYERPVEGEEVRTQINRRSRRIGSRNKPTILSWLIDNGTSTSVHSIDGSTNQVVCKGLIEGDGIRCTCCDKVHSVENFHVHGGSACDKPYECILIKETGISLLTSMKRSWRKSNESNYQEFNNICIPNAKDSFDDSCIICADGGDLICCDNCLSTYHSGCIDMEDQPDESWYCPYCICKFCAKPALEGVGRCPQCEKQYHWECHQLQEDIEFDLNRTLESQFCQRSCQQVCDELESMAGRQNVLSNGYSWTLLRRMDVADNVETKWIINHAKLAVARRLMQQCFDRIEDRYTKVDVIPSVVYNCGSNFPRLDYKGFYTAILEKDGVIFSAASLRVHGTKLAEMPFIATSEEYRGTGMCSRLMAAIEMTLRSLNVERIIVPSVADSVGLWMNKRGFRHLDSAMIKELPYYKTVMFHDSIRLQKLLLPPQMAAGNPQEPNEAFIDEFHKA